MHPTQDAARGAHICAIERRLFLRKHLDALYKLAVDKRTTRTQLLMLLSGLLALEAVVRALADGSETETGSSSSSPAGGAP